MNNIRKQLLYFRYPEESVSTQFRVIASCNSQVPNGPLDLFDLLSPGSHDTAGHRTLLQVKSKGIFHVWITPVPSPETSPWTLEDGIAHSKSFFSQRDPQSTTFLYTSGHITSSEKNERTYSVTFLNLKSDAAQSVLVSYQERQALEESTWTPETVLSKRMSFVRENAAFVATGFFTLLLCIAVATIVVIKQQTSSSLELWMHWDHKHTIGPDQLQFTYPHPNFTTWAAETHHDKEEWFVRIDDQAMIPDRLIDDDERKYQDWFRRRYPTYEAIRSSKDYLNETYWKHALHQHAQLEIDHDFHIAHCILVMKRYWHAMESGRHVCPRDVHHGHIGHCFSVLEQLAIVDWTQDASSSEQVIGTSNSWIVNACF